MVLLVLPGLVEGWVWGHVSGGRRVNRCWPLHVEATTAVPRGMQLSCAVPALTGCGAPHLRGHSNCRLLLPPFVTYLRVQEESYDVERIMAVRQRDDGGKEYLIK